jgi:hypothetical protein
MLSSEESLRAVGLRVQQRRAELKGCMEERRKRLLALEDLEVAMRGAPGSFDDEDSASVEAARKVHQQALQDLARADAEQEKLRDAAEKLLAEMSQCLDARTDVLERHDAASGVLRDHPELCQAFAKKQVALQALVERRLGDMMSRTAAVLGK